MNTVRSSDGTQIAFDQYGAGPALIVIGGALSDRAAAVPLANALADRFAVFAYDRRGRGESGDTPPYAVEREIDDVRAVVDEAGGEAFLVGHSSGAVLALEAAANGVRAPKVAVYEPPFIVDASRPPLPVDYIEHLDDLVAAGRRGDAVAYFMNVGVGMPREAIEQMRAAPMWPGLEALAHTISYDGRVMGDTISGKPLPTERWSAVTVPTLVLDGGASPPWQRAAARALADALPGARYRTLEGQEHAASPEVLAPVLVEFFEE